MNDIVTLMLLYINHWGDMIELKIYRTEDNKEPFSEWFKKLKSRELKSRIFKAIGKMEMGLLSDCKHVGEGVQEIRLHFEKGYRLYFDHDGDKLIILLMGSDKSDQSKAIALAQEYWKSYKQQKKNLQKTGTK